MQVAQASHSIDLDITPLSGRIGAEIGGLRLDGDLPAAVIAAIQAALARYRVVFFRGQDHLGDAGQEAFARRFGELVAHPTRSARAGSSAMLELDGARNRADRWHTDATFSEAYPKLSVLRAVALPPFGGDTIWANTVAAYEGLPPGLKALADTLRAVHSNLYDYAAIRPQASAAAKKDYEEVFTATVYETEHPVVRVLAGGMRSLLLGNFVRRFVGYSQSDFNHLFEVFQTHVTSPENTVRWRWQPGDVAMWDNTATQHCAVNDYGEQRRVVRRSTVRGEAPVGVDGRVSLSLRQTAKPQLQPPHRAAMA